MRMIRICFGLILLLAASGRMLGQAGATGSILGTITDGAGAILPNVQVTVTNTATGSAFQTVTSSAGDYLAPALSPGTYSVSAQAQGFKKSVTTWFTLTVDQVVRVDLRLKPGAATETEAAMARAVALDTDSAALSQLVSRQQVEELPLNGRNFMQLLLVGAGAVTVGGEQGTLRQGEGDAVSVNGGRPEGNNYTLDGLVNTDPALVTPAVVLSQDAIQEFKVESGTYPAEYGFSASQVNIVSKSGSNEFHGALFESNRNDAFDALPFATVLNLNSGVATTNPILRQNQFGFVMDGPVEIPKLYNGRGKTFWMANYEGWRINNGSIAYETVPNPAVLSGDFSAETYAPGVGGLPGGLLPAYGTSDCATLLANGFNCMPVDPTTGQAFQSNRILSTAFTSRIGQVAVANKFWGTPTLANQPEGITNLIKQVPGPLTTNQQTYRGDQVLGKLGTIFFRITYANHTNSSLYNSGSFDYGMEKTLENEKSWEVSHTVKIGRAMVNNFRFGYLYAEAPQGSVAPPAAVVSALAETGVFTKFGPLQETWPNVSLSTYASGGGPGNSYSGSSSPAWEWADSFTTVHGKHTLGFGLDYRAYTLTRNADDDFYGDFGFSSGTITNNNLPITAGGASSCGNAPVSVGGAAPTSLCGTGNAVADMMLGYYSDASGFVPGPLSTKTQAGNPQTHVFRYFAPYGKDDWKVTRKLTLNLGLRWDFRAATYEASNHFFWLDTKNAEGGLCYADPQLTSDGVAPGVGMDGGPILRYCGPVPHPGPKTPFAPRCGFAYRFNDKTVLRGGYGIFYDSYEGHEIGDSADIYPYSIRNNLVPTAVPTLPKLSNQMFPSYTTLGPLPEMALSFIAVIESENPLNPYVQSWTASMERELGRSTSLEVNYIGTHSIHLLDRRDISQPYSVAAASVAYCQQTDAAGNYINLGVAPCTISSRLPYPNFNGYYIDSDFHGYSHYNAMNVKAEHRTGDLSFTSVYSWAHSTDDKSAAAGVGASNTGYQGFMDNHDANRDFGQSDFDVSQRFVASYVYNLPIGRGKKIGRGVSRLADLAIGGWEVTGITTFQAGFPFSIGASDIHGVQGTFAQRANLVPGCSVHGGLTQPFQRLNMACFAQPALATYGNSPRNFLRQPGIDNWNMGFAKSVHLTERINFQINVDTFNTFNHHQYSGDVGGLIVSGSGGNDTIDNEVNDSEATAGKITGASSPRILQLAGKISF